MYMYMCMYEVVIWNLLFSGGGHIPGSTACSVLFWVDIALRNSNSIYICMYARMYVCMYVYMYLIGSGRSVGSLVWFRSALFILPQVRCMYAGGKTALIFVGIRCGITVIHTYIHTYIHSFMWLQNNTYWHLCRLQWGYLRARRTSLSKKSPKYNACTNNVCMYVCMYVRRNVSMYVSMQVCADISKILS